MDIDIVKIAEVVLAVLGIASIVARLTPTKKDDKILNAILQVIHLVGLTKPEEKK